MEPPTLTLEQELEVLRCRLQVEQDKLCYARGLVERLLPYAEESTTLPDVLGPCPALCNQPTCVHCVPWKVYYQTLGDARCFLSLPSR